MKVLVAQSCLTLCNPMNCGPPGSSVHGILQARLEWVAILFSRGSSQPRDLTWVSYNEADSLPSEPHLSCICLEVFKVILGGHWFGIYCKESIYSKRRSIFVQMLFNIMINTRVLKNNNSIHNIFEHLPYCKISTIC